MGIYDRSIEQIDETLPAVEIWYMAVTVIAFMLSFAMCTIVMTCRSRFKTVETDEFSSKFESIVIQPKKKRRKEYIA
jgi:hypothetical protein